MKNKLVWTHECTYIHSGTITIDSYLPTTAACEKASPTNQTENFAFHIRRITMAKLFLGYWDIHGLGSPIRFLLEIAGVDYEDKRYQIEDRDNWIANKDSLGLYVDILATLTTH